VTTTGARRAPLRLCGLLGLLGYLLFIPAQALNIAVLPGREAEATLLRAALEPLGVGGWLALGGPLSGIAWQLVLHNVPLALTLAGYAGGIVVVRRAGDSSALRRSILAWTGLYLLAGLAIYPQTADVWYYLANARAWAIYGANPYVIPVTAVTDPSSIAALNTAANGGYAWFSTYSYGPLWLIISSALALVAGDNPWAGLLLMKLVLIPCVGCGLWGIDRGLRALSPEHRSLAWLLYAWNPLLLFVGVAGAHNDVAMAALATLGLALAIEGNAVASLPVLAASLLVKYAAWPYALASLLSLSVWRRERLRVSILGAALAGCFAIALFAPFWTRPQAFFTGAQSVLATQPGITPLDWVTRQLETLPRFAAYGVPQSYYAAQAVAAPLGWGLYVVLVAGALWVWRRRPPGELAARLALVLVLAYFYTAASLFRMWYGVWLVPLLALCAPHKRWWLAAVLFTVAALIAANAFLVLLLGGPNWRVWLTPLIYLPPLVPLVGPLTSRLFPQKNRPRS
jgi:hypothetical protein